MNPAVTTRSEGHMSPSAGEHSAGKVAGQPRLELGDAEWLADVVEGPQRKRLHDRGVVETSPSDTALEGEDAELVGRHAEELAAAVRAAVPAA